jgi:hypothetical protein
VEPSSSRNPGTIRVWSIQHADCWELFQKQGFLRADGRRVSRHFLPAYRWLMEQMRERLPGYTGGFPVWFWSSPKPDLRQHGHLAPGVHGVRIELELPRERALLLDFETWHCVLNRWHLSRSWRESADWDRRTKGFDRCRATLPPPFEQELRTTWERIFDFELLRRTRIWGPIKQIQGVTGYVRLDEVRSVRDFTGR